jgi:hypothetical protein
LFRFDVFQVRAALVRPSGGRPMSDPNGRRLAAVRVAPSAARSDGAPACASDPLDAAVRTIVDAFRSLVRAALHDELASLRREAGTAQPPSANADAPTDARARLLSVADVAARVGVAPATVREWIKSGYPPAIPLGPAGRRYGIRWADAEASLTKRAKPTTPTDLDAAASQIMAGARARASRRRGA